MSHLDLQNILLSPSGQPIKHIIYNIASIIDIVEVFFIFFYKFKPLHDLNIY